MISFSWSAVSDEIALIRIKTPVVKIGTLYRLTSAIYALGFNIQSGDVRTVEEKGELLSDDRFSLKLLKTNRISENLATMSSRLGMLMESLLSDTSDPDLILKDNEIDPPDSQDIFASSPILLFEKREDCTRFYIECIDRTGLLFHLTRVFYDLGINILDAKIRTRDGTIAEDDFLIQFEGQPLSEELAHTVENRILG